MTSFTPYTWTCPHCKMMQVITSAQVWSLSSRPEVTSKYSGLIANVKLESCANIKCRELSLSVGLSNIRIINGMIPNELCLFRKRVYPDGATFTALHESVPAAIVEDYSEGWAIADLSPKAAATLARRALQGMIRNFAGIAKPTLIAEIKALRDAVASGSAPRGVTPESIDAIDHVRKIGNIGAHMEKDIDVIIPVEPDEAKTLLQLVELLAKEWYEAQSNRQAMLEAVKTIKESKAPNENQKAEPAVSAASNDVAITKAD